MTAAPGSAAGTAEPLTIDELARQVALPVRTIREYHTMRLLPPPERRGRVGLYGPRHVQRLELITRLQRRGYSLAGIRDLLGAWESGSDLTTLLGVGGGQAPLDETPDTAMSGCPSRTRAIAEASKGWSWTIRTWIRLGTGSPADDASGLRSLSIGLPSQATPGRFLGADSHHGGATVKRMYIQRSDLS